MNAQKIEPPAQRAARLQLEHKAIGDVWCDWTNRGAPYGPSELEIEHSKAISLKRIADALESQAGIAATSAAYAPASHDLRGELDA